MRKDELCEGVSIRDENNKHLGNSVIAGQLAVGMYLLFIFILGIHFIYYIDVYCLGYKCTICIIQWIGQTIITRILYLIQPMVMAPLVMLQVKKMKSFRSNPLLYNATNVGVSILPVDCYIY